ncbi:MAG: YihY/virulence factor BrkB family protein [Lachnospiraceae bacterium]
MKRIYDLVMKLTDSCSEHHINASAANAAYFIMLSLIPCLILLMTLIQFTNIGRVDLILSIQRIVPRNMRAFVTTVINEAYTKTITTVSISALTAMWSAGKGMMALTQGFQIVAGVREKQNYIAVRIRSTFYTILLLLAVFLFLIAGVFGNSLSELIVQKIPFAAYAVEVFRKFRTVFLILVATVLFTLIYRFVPNLKKKMGNFVPGAVFASVGWFAFSWAFSLYVDRFSGFSNMYGSLTTIILVMLWMYFIMYIILIGAEINRIFMTEFFKEEI